MSSISINNEMPGSGISTIPMQGSFFSESVSARTSECYQRILAGFCGAGTLMIGVTLAYNSVAEASLINGILESLLCSAVIGTAAGVLSDSLGDAAVNAALFGATVYSVTLLGVVAPGRMLFGKSD